MKPWYIAVAAVAVALVIALAIATAVLARSTATTAAAGDGRVVPTVPSHTEVPCGVPTLVTVPDDTDEVTYQGFTTTYGYYKVVATLTDQTRTFNTDGTFYRVSPAAPYIAEHLTLIVEPCRDADPVVPIIPPATQEPAPADPEPPAPGCYE
jgi:hypothetical protein